MHADLHDPVQRAMVTLALAGDTMLGRLVGERLASAPPASLLAPEVAAIAREADVFVLNLECCISERGEQWPSPGKPFFFRAPPVAVEVLALLGVDCVSLANNHALDYGYDALADTCTYLEGAGIAHVGAGIDLTAARAPAHLDARGYRLTVLGVADHPSDFAAGADEPGVAWADLREGIPTWLRDGVVAARREETTDGVLVTPHWGPNMVADPVPHVRRAAGQLRDAGATLVAGHSAHVFHGVEHSAEDAVLYDLGDFLDDYAVDSRLRNDLGLLFLVELDETGPRSLQAVPLALDFCHTRLASGEETDWITRRLRDACAAFGSEVRANDDRLVITWR